MRKVKFFGKNDYFCHIISYQNQLWKILRNQILLKQFNQKRMVIRFQISKIVTLKSDILCHTMDILKNGINISKNEKNK